MKRIIAIILFITLFVGVFGYVHTASASDNENDNSKTSIYYGDGNDSFSYFIERETLYVYEIVNNDDTISIPDMIGDNKVTYVWFEEAFDAKHLVLGDGIVCFNVSDNAERSFEELRAITLGVSYDREYLPGVIYTFDKLDNIYVSKENKRLKSLNGILFSKDGKTLMFYPSNRRGKYKVPKGIRNINRCAFLGSNLRKVVMPSSVKTVGDEAFSGCTKMKKIIMSSSMKTIGDEAFSNCIKLKKIVLPSGVKKLGEWLFYYCVSLEEIALPSKLRDISDYSLSTCKKLKKVVIPSGVKTIGKNAFSDCMSLKKVVIPSGVNKIEQHAFGDCKRLKEIVIRGKKTKVEHQAIGFNCKRLSEYIINKKTVIVAPKGSRAQKYAKKNGIKFKLTKNIK